MKIQVEKVRSPKPKAAMTFAVWFLFAMCSSQGVAAQESVDFDRVAQETQQKLEDSLQELSELTNSLKDDKIGLHKQLNELEAELLGLEAEYRKTTRVLDTRRLDLSNLTKGIEDQRKQTAYLESLLGDYIVNFKAGIHVSEDQLYQELFDTALLAPENSNLSDFEVFEIQASLLDRALDRLFESLGGTSFEGQALSSASSELSDGRFVLFGPYALFQANGSDVAGTAEPRPNSAGVWEVAFSDPETGKVAGQLVSSQRGTIPFDPTLGAAHKIEKADKTVLEEVEDGGPVMYPIFAMAGLALLFALYKWVHLTLQRKPRQKRIEALLAAVSGGQQAEIEASAQRIQGPAGKMLRAGVEHLNEPRELIEEVMYEQVLTTKLRLQSLLPFIAICAASAPLLGLLGTVSGIINTFKMITVFGSGDVKSLSGGISEALITTKYGLIVAIPSLLLHAFLSRKARGVLDQMEKSAIAFVNQLSKTSFGGGGTNGSQSSKGVEASASETVPASDSKEFAKSVDDVLVPQVGGSAEQGQLQASGR